MATRNGLLALALLLPAASAFAQGQVYKCGKGGAVTFQDSPCPGAPTAAPYIAGPAGDATADAAAIGPGTSTASLLAAQKIDEARLRDLESQYRLDLTAADKRTAGHSEAEWQRARSDLGARWQVRLQVVRDHQQRVRDELKRRCSASASKPADPEACGD